MTDTTPLITGVDFVCIPAQNFDAMTAFYGETLGLPFLKRYGSRPGAEYQPAISRWRSCAPRTSAAHSRATRCRSLCRSVTWQSHGERLEAKGVRFVSKTFDSGVCWQAICLDPDGNPLSLHHRHAPKDERPSPPSPVAPGDCLIGTVPCLRDMEIRSDDKHQASTRRRDCCFPRPWRRDSCS
jgi:glyoxalase/bleomycin resistance protein/dioxygenase superfamily protein